MLFSAPTHRTPTKPWDTNHSNFLRPPQSDIWGQVVCREEWDGAGLENNIGVENIGDWQSRQAWRQPSLVVPTKATFQTSRYFHISCAIIIQVRVEAVLTREKIWLWFAEKDNSSWKSLFYAWNLWRYVRLIPNVLVMKNVSEFHSPQRENQYIT